MKIYVVQGESGSEDSYTCWNVKAFTDHRQAEIYCLMAKAWLVDRQLLMPDWDENGAESYYDFYSRWTTGWEQRKEILNGNPYDTESSLVNGEAIDYSVSELELVGVEGQP